VGKYIIDRLGGFSRKMLSFVLNTPAGNWCRKLS